MRNKAGWLATTLVGIALAAGTADAIDNDARAKRDMREFYAQRQARQAQIARQEWYKEHKKMVWWGIASAGLIVGLLIVDKYVFGPPPATFSTHATGPYHSYWAGRDENMSDY